MTRAEADQALDDARRAGIDLNLIELNLALTPVERWRQHDAALEVAMKLRNARMDRDEQIRLATATAR